jgi:hypothetical protein
VTEPERVQPLLITLEEAARLIGMSPKWIRLNKKTLNFVRELSPRVLKADPVALRRWVDQRRP